MAHYIGNRILRQNDDIPALKEAIAALKPAPSGAVLVRDLVPAGKCCVLVVPIDAGAPKGRLILPQQQAIRDLLEGGAMPIVCRDHEYERALSSLREPPALVITDSQVFPFVAQKTPESVALTSFSMLFARLKGDLSSLVRGAKAVVSLEDGDHILIAEGCTHHRQCEDIGTKKIPALLEARTGKRFCFQFSSGGGFTEKPGQFKLIIHCGACMLTQSQMKTRMDRAADCGVPMVNYGVLIAQLNGILPRCLAPFGMEP